MRTMPFLVVALLATLAAKSALANSFPGPGLWDPLPLDADVYPPASVEAAIAATDARIDALKTPNAGTNAGAGPAGDPLQQTCSLQVGSVALPANGSVDNQTIVAIGNVTGTIIQVCR